MKSTQIIIIAVLSIAIILAAAVGALYLGQPTQTIIITGAGATFPAPLLTSMITNYHKVHSQISITYDAVGSGSGILFLENKTRDFSCSDAPLSASDRTKAPNTLHIPLTIGAVAVAYNLEGVPTGLQLTGEVIADIFSGKITSWSDPAIQELNQDTNLPSIGIMVVHRAESSGTTFIFTSYLSMVSSDWESSIGSGKKVNWPVGLEATGNPGVAEVVQANPGAIGYVELAYVIENNMTVVAVQNPAGNWITPSLESTQVAAQSGASSGLPEADSNWENVSILNTSGTEAYPIVSFSYTFVYKELNVVSGMTSDKATALAGFLWWATHEGQDLAPDLGYAHLPDNVVDANEAAIRSITFDGQKACNR